MAYISDSSFVKKTIQYSGNLPSDGLVSFWKFDKFSGENGVILDQIRNNHITFSSPLTFISGHDESAFTALQGGCGQGVAAFNNNVAYSGIAGEKDITVACWVKNGTDSKGFWCLSYVAGTTANFGLYDYTNILYVANNPTGGPNNALVANPFPVGWSHVAITRNTLTNSSKTYINGVSAYTFAEDDTVVSGDQKITIGNFIPDTSSYDWTDTMAISSMILYERCLSDVEIQQIYENT